VTPDRHAFATELPPRSTGKRVLLRALLFGAGFAAVVCAVTAAALWYVSRPTPPPPWNTSAIAAHFDGLDTEGERNTFVFTYVLENSTDWDYRLDNTSSIATMAQLKNNEAMVALPAETLRGPDIPVFIPARRRVRVRLHLEHTFPDKGPPAGSPQADQDSYSKRLAQQLAETLPNLDGFVLFDNLKHYEIDFQRGW